LLPRLTNYAMTSSVTVIRNTASKFVFLKFHLGRADYWHSTNQVMIMGCVYFKYTRSIQSLTKLKYITWISDDKVSWTFKGPGMGPDPSVQVSARPVSQEPMVAPFSKSNSNVNPYSAVPGRKLGHVSKLRTDRSYTSNVPSAHEN
jgi:hypothetical protein